MDHRLAHLPFRRGMFAQKTNPGLQRLCRSCSGRLTSLRPPGCRRQHRPRSFLCPATEGVATGHVRGDDLTSERNVLLRRSRCHVSPLLHEHHPPTHHLKRQSGQSFHLRVARVPRLGDSHLHATFPSAPVHASSNAVLATARHEVARRVPARSAPAAETRLHPVSARR